MTTRYTLYAGRRDCFVDIKFNKPVTEYQFATGIINVKNSEELSDKKVCADAGEQTGQYPRKILPDTNVRRSGLASAYRQRM